MKKISILLGILLLGFSLIACKPKVETYSVHSETELRTAVENAKEGCVFRLENDITVTAGGFVDDVALSEAVFRLPKNAIFDLGGHTVTVSRNGGLILEGENIIVQNGSFVTADTVPYALFIGDEGENNSATLKNLRLDGGMNVYNSLAKLENCNIDATAHLSETTTTYAIWADEEATVTIESGEYKKMFCVCSTTSPEPNKNGNIVINGGVFYGAVCATADTTINGGTFENGAVVLLEWNDIPAKLTVGKEYTTELHIVGEYDVSTDENGNTVYRSI